MNYKKIMLIIFLLIPILCSSQTIYPNIQKINNDTIIEITYDQLKKVNKIFIDNNSYKEQLELYKNVVQQQATVITNNNTEVLLLKQNQEINDRTIEELVVQNAKQKSEISSLDKKKNRYKTATFTLGGTTAILLLLLIL